jgi:formate/nitrite transporter FocA (FNT family)
MSSDLEAKGPEEAPSPKKPAQQILQEEIHEGIDALTRGSGSLFVSALSGGLDVGFSVMLMAVIQTIGRDKLPEPLVRILVADMYSVGFIFVIIGRSELFTEQTSLAILPLLRGRATVASLMRLWGIVYIANLMGAAIFAGMISYIGPALGMIEPAAFGAIGHRMVDHGWAIIFLSAVLAGWLMGLLSWMVVAGRDTISQIVIVWMVTTAIGLGGAASRGAGDGGGADGDLCGTERDVVGFREVPGVGDAGECGGRVGLCGVDQVWSCPA